MDKLLIFAGTYEGRVLCEFLNQNNIKATASVATGYGQEIIQNLEHIKVIQGRLKIDEIQNLIIKENYTKIIDATHPYAQIVSENIKQACKVAKREYIRLLREEGSYEGLITAKDTEEAVEILNSLEGNILLTTGSKDLAKYKGVSDFESRVFARVLPSKEVVESCEKLGIKGRNLICMQGPFSQNLNLAMLEEYNCKILVTKNTGDAGGFGDKVSAAKALGVTVVTIKRPKTIDETSNSLGCDKEAKERTYNLEQVMEMLSGKKVTKVPYPCSIPSPCNTSDKESIASIVQKRYFPTFVDSVDKLAIIVGAGEIGLKRAEKLKNFRFRVKLISEKFRYKIEGVECMEKSFENKDIEGAFIVIAATDNRRLNSAIAKLCKDKAILCSVADKGSEGSFIFPALINSGEGLIAVSSDGKSPKTTKLLAKKLREGLSSNLEVQGENSCWK